MSVHSGSEEEEMCMEFYAVPAVEGLVEGGKGPQQGSIANSVQKFRFSPTCSRAKRPAHMDRCILPREMLDMCLEILRFYALNLLS